MSVIDIGNIHLERGHRVDPRSGPTVPVAAPIRPLNMHNISVPMYWPGDEYRTFQWDSVDYVAAPRSVVKIPAKLQHQRDGLGKVLFDHELEQAPNGDPATIATALERRYGHEGLTVLGGDEDDQQRKKEARELKYNPHRLALAHKRRENHRAACARAMQLRVAAPLPYPEREADEMFIRAMSGGAHGVESRFACQLDGSRWATRSQAWARVKELDESQAKNPDAVLDTMPEIKDPEAVVAGQAGAAAAVPAAALPTPVLDALARLRAEAQALKLRAFDEGIMFPEQLRRDLQAEDIGDLQAAVALAAELLDGPNQG